MAIVGWKITKADRLAEIITKHMDSGNMPFEMSGLVFKGENFIEPVECDFRQMEEHLLAKVENRQAAFELPADDERTQMQVLRKFAARLGCSVEQCPWNPNNLLFKKLEAKVA